MRIFRKYGFMIFLAVVFWSCIVALLVPPWEKDIRILVSGAFAVMCLWYLLSQLSRIEGKLDVILKKLDGD
jgi:hypothetical protein